MDVSGLHAGLFVEAHGTVIAAPHIQCDKAAACGFGEIGHMIVEFGGDVLTAAVFVHAQVVDIQLFPVGKNTAARDFTKLAEAVTCDEAVLIVYMK